MATRNRGAHDLRAISARDVYSREEETIRVTQEILKESGLKQGAVTALEELERVQCPLAGWAAQQTKAYPEVSSSLAEFAMDATWDCPIEWRADVDGSRLGIEVGFLCGLASGFDLCVEDRIVIGAAEVDDATTKNG